MRFNFKAKEMILKIVYFGPSLGGKTTSLRAVYSQLSPDIKGKFMSINTKDDRTLFFDFFDLSTTTKWGEGSIKIRFELYTVPGQVSYEETRRLVMKGADGVVFVADSQDDKMDDNIYSIKDLNEILVNYGKDPETFPIVLQYNKRDLPNIYPVEELKATLNVKNWKDFPTVAITSKNIMEALKGISEEVIKAGKREYSRGRKI